MFLKLCDRADAIVENMRAGVMDDLGLGYEVISSRNAKIVYACVRGFGDPRTGSSPYADWPCLDAAAQSFGGLVHANDNLVTPALADIFPGTLMALGVVSAIHHAQRAGKGQFLDVSMYDAMLAFSEECCGAIRLHRQTQPGRAAARHDAVPVRPLPHPRTDGSRLRQSSRIIGTCSVRPWIVQT